MQILSKTNALTGRPCFIALPVVAQQTINTGRQFDGYSDAGGLR